MRVLFTGASSAIGGAVLKKLLATTEWEFVCSRHRGEITVGDPRMSVIELDLVSEYSAEDLPEKIDLVIHFAAVTHAREPQTYWRMNRDATERLANALSKRGCSRFVYISSRCATAGSGDYGESKLAAEKLLKAREWQSLTIIRPSEIYGGNGAEGIDKFIALARDKHVVPLLFGDRNIRFSPLHIDDFVSQTASKITELNDGVSIVEMCGPEELSGVEVATRLARKFNAVPIPFWWPATRLGVGAVNIAGLYPVEPDQVSRLVCKKTCQRSDEPGLKRFYP